MTMENRKAMQTADTLVTNDWNVSRPGLSVSLAASDDDVFIFLDAGLVPARYQRHFLRTPLTAECHENLQMHL
ncbi:hypothetical protein [Ectothiorhodospira shaposhnikovii]|uniref:hypothetical protein n=1 Tax=Ectothiorhodospira shaposhnikovii TaxID=1054 RepID=UPI00399F4960